MTTPAPDWWTPHTEDYAETYADDEGVLAEEFADNDTQIRFTIERGRPGYAEPDGDNPEPATPEENTMNDPFWAAVREQLAELRGAKSADDVIRILSPDRNPYGPDWDGMDSAADGFFVGSGGDDTVFDALRDAGWERLWMRAGFFYAMEAPDGSRITYIEGDIYKGDHRS